MSLVAYAASSDEETDNEDDSSEIATVPTNLQKEIISKASVLTNGQSKNEANKDLPRSSSLQLPKPKNNTITFNDPSKELQETVTPIFARLPMPKESNSSRDVVEEDDEFLHKKAIPLEDPKAKRPLPVPTSLGRTSVKFTVPSMKDFADVEADIARSGQQRGMQTHITTAKKSGLLAVLPKAKSEQNFAKSESQKATEKAQNPPDSSIHKSSNKLIPDTVRNRRPAHNTEGVDFQKVQKNMKSKVADKPTSSKPSLVDCSDSEDSNDEAGDFFSLNDEEKLPEVNANELNVMVAKRAAKMAMATTKYLESSTADSFKNETPQQPDDEEMRQAQKRYHESELNEEALQALVGSKSKRRRQQSQIQIVDISGNEVLPNKEEWMRTALASSTSYQPTGVLVDEEPASGTRRKHQITYLAHKAKANEAELQAMWAANRQNRRATQSKYGF